MNYKKLFETSILLITSPVKAWEMINEENPMQVQMGFVYPMLSFCGLSYLIGSLLSSGWSGPQSFQIAMISCIAVAVGLFGTFFITAYTMNQVAVKSMKAEDNFLKMQQFVGYSMVVVFVLKLLLGLLPDFGIISFLLMIYTVYIVWEGSRVVLDIPENNRLTFTSITSIMIIVMPIALEMVFKKLSTYFN